jgi:epoxyqueuosine reductase
MAFAAIKTLHEPSTKYLSANRKPQTMNPTAEFAVLTASGCKFRVVSTCHLADLQAEIEGRRDRGEFDSQFSKDYLFSFNFSPPAELPNAQSIVVVSMPRPPTKAIFNWNGRKQSFILPPTYTAYDEKRLQVERFVAEAVLKHGYNIATPRLPLKLLAVRSGLAEYGRPNITFAMGMGSFMRITAVYTDMPTETDNWQEPKTMKRCQSCDLCQKACPTGAISQDRFLLHAEKCLTYHNEKPASVPFPAWIKPQWHNCIVGCMRCQAACPENKPFLNMLGETAEFTDEETGLLLKATPPEQLPQTTAAKMKVLSLFDYYKELPRNLGALLQPTI